MFTYSGEVKIARMDGADILTIYVGKTVRAIDEIEVEAECHMGILKSVEIAYPGYRVLQFPTVTNGKLVIRKASDAAW